MSGNSEVDQQLIAERAAAQKHTPEEMIEIIGSISLFLENKTDQSLPELKWVEDEDYPIIENNPAVVDAHKTLDEARHYSEAPTEREKSRLIEWKTLFEAFLDHATSDSHSSTQTEAA